MFRLSSSISVNSPEPFPSSTFLDESQINPGPIGGIVLFFLTIAVVLLLFSMNRHIKKVNFEQDETNSN